MPLNCGIVGLPNVGIVVIPDVRLDRIAGIIRHGSRDDFVNPRADSP